MKEFLNVYGVGLTIAAFVVAVFLSPWLFTGNGFERLNFANTGQIGDTIGGLTAPVIGILNAVLLWWTIRKQNQQIADQNRQINAYNIDSEIQQRIQSIRDIRKNLVLIFRIRGSSGTKQVKGKEAILLVKNILEKEEGFYKEFYVHGTEWVAFFDELKDIVLESYFLIKLNHKSDKPLEDKSRLYYVIMFQNNGVRELYQKLNTFIINHQEVEIAKRYIIPDWEDELKFFEETFEFFDSLSPAR